MMMPKTEIKKSYLVKIYPRQAEFLKRVGKKLPRSKGKLNLSGGIEEAARILELIMEKK